MLRLLPAACGVAIVVVFAGGDVHAVPPAAGPIVSLSIVPGAQAIAIGDRLRLAVLARHADGSVEDRARSATWRFSGAAVRAVGTGVVRGVAKGRTTVVAAVGDMRATTSIRVGSRSLGPLRVSRRNPRYFEDAAGRVLYLAGDHTWSTLQDNGTTDPPPRFDYPRFLEDLQTHDLRVFRLWAWEEGSKTGEIKGDYFFSPTVYRRTGPGTANDGKPKFDLQAFNPAYFSRMRRRVIAARERGIYVIVMLFDGWSVERKGDGDNPWTGHPFNRANNINGVDGDLNGDRSGRETHTLASPQITHLQERYVARVIRAVGDQPNVLYEISNESSPGSMPWQNHMVRFIHAHEPAGSRQPAGITAEYPDGRNADLLASDADWIAPNGDIENLTPSSGRKVVFADTDHLCGVCGDEGFPWRAFARGLNPMFMDPYDGKAIGLGALGRDPRDPRWEVLRRRLGLTESLAERLDMGSLVPRGDLASTGYCLADTRHGSLYVVYLPDGGSATVDVSASPGRLRVSWVDPGTGVTTTGGTVAGGGKRSFDAPGTGDAVLVLRRAG
jgi:Putative collagen-binding domain of a collagenase